MIETFLDGIRQSTRAIKRLLAERRFTLAFVTTLALGLAANLTVFAMLDAYLLHPLPYPQSPRLVEVYTSARKFHFRGISSSAYHALRRSRVFAASGFIRGRSSARVRLHPGGAPQLLSAAYVTASLFPTLGIHPLIGHWPSAAASTPDGPREVVLSEAFWHEAFAGNPRVLGLTLTLHHQVYTIVGIMPQTFAFPTRRTKLWFATVLKNALRKGPFDNIDGSMIARLAPGVGPTVLKGALDSSFQHLMRQAPPEVQTIIRQLGGYASFTPLRHWLAGSTLKRLLIIQLGAGLLLLLALSSLTNLALVRLLDRYPEQALRLALGAGPRAALPALLGESLLLALFATLPAWPLADVGTMIFSAFGIGSTHTAFRATLPLWSAPALWLFATVLCFVILGLPRLVLRRRDPRILLAGGSRLLGSAGIGRLRAGLTLIQIGLSVLLLIATLLIGTALVAMLDRNPGFNTRHLDAAEIMLTRNDEMHWSAYQATVNELHELVKRLPAHPITGIGRNLPFLGSNLSVFVPGNHFVQGSRNTLAHDVFVNPGALRTLGVHLLSGRLIDERDIIENAKVVVVDKRLAERLFGTTHVLGKTLSGLDSGNRIIGIVDTIHDRFDPAYRTTAGTIFYPDEKSVFPVSINPVDLLFRSDASPTLLRHELQAALQRSLPNLILVRLAPLPTVIRHSLEGTRALSILIGAFALLALVLASTGTFGVMAYLVDMREREFALREALGASPDLIAWLVFRQGLWLWVAGALLGIASAWWGVHLLATRVYGLNTPSPLGYVLPTFAVGLVVLLACAIPALRLRRLPLSQRIRG